MLLKELIRFSTQHRTLYLLMILSIWIFLIIAGMYKYIGSSNSETVVRGHHSGAAARNANDDPDDEETLQLRAFKQRCSPLDQLQQRHDDGGILDGWRLVGVLLIIRHGDRGPMSHVRGIADIDCGAAPSDTLVNRYRSFLYNASAASASGANHMYWSKVGPFHTFPLLPAADNACMLGQLTYRGIAQLLHVGELLHQIYAHPLGLPLKQSQQQQQQQQQHTPSDSNATPPLLLLNSDEVVVFATRYRRTFQSALALLYALLPADKWLALNVREAHSFYFCFSDCACGQAEHLRKRLLAMQQRQLQQRPNVASTMQWVGGRLLQHTPNGIRDLNEVLDALLAVVCHEAPLPCRHGGAGNGSTTNPPPGDIQQQLELSDVINIDQEDDAAANILDLNAAAPLADGSAEGGGVSAAVESGGGCIEQAHVATLAAYGHWQSQREASLAHYKRLGLLRAYGMVRHLVSQLLKMISGDRTKFVLYSGHDWTLQYLTVALGISATTPTHIPSYAARLAIELYRSETRPDYYFRTVLNGRDVTSQMEFCAGGRSLRVTRDSRGNKADLCPIENLIRFLHEDYFMPLNATNFKDACMVSTATRGSEF